MQSATVLKPTAIDKKKEPVRTTSKTYTTAYDYATRQLVGQFYTTLFIISIFFAILFQLNLSFNYRKRHIKEQKKKGRE